MSDLIHKDSPSRRIRPHKLRLFAVLVGRIAWALLPMTLLMLTGIFCYRVAIRTNEPRACQESLSSIIKLKSELAEAFSDTPDGDLSANAFFEHAASLTCPSTGQAYIFNKIGEDPVCPSGLAGHSLSEIPGRDGGGEH